MSDHSAVRGLTCFCKTRSRKVGRSVTSVGILWVIRNEYDFSVCLIPALMTGIVRFRYRQLDLPPNVVKISYDNFTPG